MATRGNNFRKDVAEMRDNLADSFDEQFKGEIRGEIEISNIKNYILSKKYNELLNKIRNEDNNTKFNTINVIDYMMANGLIAPEDTEQMETTILAILDSIEDAHMVREDDDQQM